MSAIYTCCDAKYQWFLPTWAYSARRAWPDADIQVDYYGDLHTDCLALLQRIGVRVAFLECYNLIPSCTRFTFNSKDGSEVLITDCDIAFLDSGVLDYLRTKMLLDGLGCYAAFQGARKRPIRPDIAPDGWVGNMRRLCGGFVLVTPEWWSRTVKARVKYHTMIHEHSWGGYREADEVMLCRICEESGLPLPGYQKFAEIHRNLHVGDFREDMNHRWTNDIKMMRLLPAPSIDKAKTLLEDEGFQDVLSEVRLHGDEVVTYAWKIAIAHIMSFQNPASLGRV